MDHTLATVIVVLALFFCITLSSIISNITSRGQCKCGCAQQDEEDTTQAP